MRSVTQPTDQCGAAYRVCANKVRNPQTKARLLAVDTQVVAAGEDYKTKAEAVVLHTFPQATGIPSVSDDEFKDLYRQLLKTEPGREIYDRIRNAPRDRWCPLCGAQPATTLDHHLARTHYPVVSVAPLNLVPACKDCQFEKLQAYPTSDLEQTLHPYFDAEAEERWLFAQIVEGAPPVLTFAVTAPAGWSNLKRARYEHHLRTFKLDKRFSQFAGQELVNMKFRLELRFQGGGAAAVREHLQEQAETHSEASLNSWQTATYEACAASDWLCTEGFLLI